MLSNGVLLWSDLQASVHLEEKPQGVLGGVPCAVNGQLLQVQAQAGPAWR